MNRRPTYRALSAAWLCSLLVGCGALNMSHTDDSSSRLTQLTKKEYQCRNWDDARVASVREQSKTFASEYYQGSRWSKKFYKAMAGIPDEYHGFMRDRAASRKRFRIFTRRSASGVSYTSWTSFSERIAIDNSAWGFDFSLQHEVGHFIEDYLAKIEAPKRGFSQQQFYNELTPIADGRCNDPNLSEYARAYRCGSDIYRTEFFAEAFNSYYCSEETNELVRSQFGDVHAFMEKYFVQPVWKTSGAAAGPTILLGASNPNQANERQVWIATPSSATGAGICLKSPSACQDNFEEAVGFDRVNVTVGPSKNIYLGRYYLDPSKTRELTIAMYNQDGSKTLRRLRLTPRS